MSESSRKRGHKTLSADMPRGEPNSSNSGSPQAKKALSSNFAELASDPEFISFVTNIVTATLSSSQALSAQHCQICQRLADKVEELTKEVALLKSSPARPLPTTPPSGYWETPNLSRTENSATALFVSTRPQFKDTHLVASALQNSAVFVEKQKLLVLEQLPDLNRSSTKEQPDDKETALAQQLCDSAGVGHDFVRAWRVPSHENATRPFKIKLKSVESRNKVLFGFRKNFVKFASSWKPASGRRVSARRDMTRPELQCHREMRKWVWEENKKLGESKYYYHDLNIYLNKFPQKINYH